MLDDLARHRLELHDKAITRLEEQVVELRRQMNTSLTALSQWQAADRVDRRERHVITDQHREATDRRLERVEQSILESISAANQAYAALRAERTWKLRLLAALAMIEALGLAVFIGIVYR